MNVRLGKTLPIESKVFLPIIRVCPLVFSLKNFKSAGRCHKSLLSFPIALFVELATIILSVIMLQIYLYPPDYFIFFLLLQEYCIMDKNIQKELITFLKNGEGKKLKG